MSRAPARCGCTGSATWRRRHSMRPRSIFCARALKGSASRTWTCSRARATTPCNSPPSARRPWCSRPARTASATMRPRARSPEISPPPPACSPRPPAPWRIARCRGYRRSSGARLHRLATVFFADRLKELTNGEIEVTIHPAGELGSDPALLEGVRLGTIDFAQTGNPFYTRFQPRLNVLDLPYLFEDYEHVYSVIDGEIGTELLAGLEDDGMKGIAFWEIGFRKITNSVRPIRAPEDLRGLKICTTPNPAHVQAFELWGAT